MSCKAYLAKHSAVQTSITFTDTSLLLITTDGYRYSRVEGRGETVMFSIGSDGDLQLCPINSLPYLSLISATGSLLQAPSDNGSNVYNPVICGPQKHCAEHMDCYDMVSAKSITRTSDSLLFRRSAASVSVFNGTAIWVTGGKKCHWSWETSSQFVNLRSTILVKALDDLNALFISC